MFGRYVQSVPLGIASDISTVEYVRGNPTRFVDANGLFLTSVDAACVANPKFCGELFGQIAENAGAMQAKANGDNCVPEDAFDAATAFRDAGNLFAAVALAGAIKRVVSAGMTRVGRWMSKEEYEAMKATNRAAESFSGTTHVANPADPLAFIDR